MRFTLSSHRLLKLLPWEQVIDTRCLKTQAIIHHCTRNWIIMSSRTNMFWTNISKWRGWVWKGWAHQICPRSHSRPDPRLLAWRRSIIYWVSVRSIVASPVGLYIHRRRQLWLDGVPSWDWLGATRSVRRALWEQLRNSSAASVQGSRRVCGNGLPLLWSPVL